MVEAVIMLLVQLCVIALVVYLIIFVLGVVGISLPPKVVQILWVIGMLLAVLLILRLVLPGMGGGRWLSSLPILIG